MVGLWGRRHDHGDGLKRNPASRPSVLLQALGVSVAPGFLHDANRVIRYLMLFTVVLGFFAFMRKSQKNNAERRMFPAMTVAFTLLASAVVLPFFAGGLNLSRFYHISLQLISPCLFSSTRCHRRLLANLEYALASRSTSLARSATL